MKIRFLTPKDLEFAAEHSVSKTIFNGIQEQRQWSYTLVEDDLILVLGGIELITNQTAWAWVNVMDTVTHRDWFSVYRIVSEWIGELCKDNDIKRLQAYVECDLRKAELFVEHLDFKLESTMKNFLGEKDAYLYARIL